MDNQPAAHRGRSRNPADSSRSPQRFREFLAKMAAVGISQQEIARRTGIAAQLISDVKKGRRRLSELSARRIGDEFAIPFRWLLGHDSSAGADSGTTGPVVQSQPRASPSTQEEPIARLPAHDDPIDADPYDPALWRGTFVPLVGLAAVAARSGRRPYALRLAAGDHRGQLREGDLLLISQEPDQTQVGDIGVIRSTEGVMLAWRDGERSWASLVTGASVDCKQNVGRCVAVVWAPLVGRCPSRREDPHQSPQQGSSSISSTQEHQPIRLHERKKRKILKPKRDSPRQRGTS